MSRTSSLELEPELGRRTERCQDLFDLRERLELVQVRHLPRDGQMERPWSGQADGTVDGKTMLMKPAEDACAVMPSPDSAELQDGRTSMTCADAWSGWRWVRGLRCFRLSTCTSQEHGSAASVSVGGARKQLRGFDAESSFFRFPEGSRQGRLQQNLTGLLPHVASCSAVVGAASCPCLCEVQNSLCDLVEQVSRLKQQAHAQRCHVAASALVASFESIESCRQLRQKQMPTPGSNRLGTCGWPSTLDRINRLAHGR